MLNTLIVGASGYAGVELATYLNRHPQVNITALAVSAQSPDAGKLLSDLHPQLKGILDMPLQPLPGDLYTPNMHWNASASSERMIVSPGREQEGIMHMPTGQSGHPLSPFYSNSHPAWVNGEPTPFLPGPAVYTLTLNP